MSAELFVVEIRTRGATAEPWTDWRPCDYASTESGARALMRMRTQSQYIGQTTAYRIAIYSRQSVID